MVALIADEMIDDEHVDDRGFQLVDLHTVHLRP